MKHTLIRILLAWSLVATCLLFMQQKPLLVYHADSKYHITGKVEANLLAICQARLHGVGEMLLSIYSDSRRRTDSKT